jgi:tetratricopeptide (TPR) repeat protein
MLKDAMDLIQSGNSAAAVGRLQEVVARFPNTAEALESQYQLGVAYESLGSMKDAISAYGLYVGRSPDGERADDARQRMERLLHEYEAQFPSTEKIDQDIEALRRDLQQNPQSNDLAVRLADALWMRGEYDSSARLYLAVYDRDASVAQSEAFRNRIELHSDGSYTLLTPAELTKRERSLNPLSVINLSSFSAIRDTFTQVPYYYVVTGQAVNRGDSVLYEVEVTITIYGFGGDVYDTQTIPLGVVRPGEIRALSARFSNFRDIDSIDRYDYTVSFRR